MKVLFVDDDLNILELLSILIENSFDPAEITKCTGPTQAINHLKKSTFNLVICDFEMGSEGNGDLVYQFIRDNGIKTPFLLFTSRGREETNYDPNTYPTAQFHYLQKPALPNILRELIGEMASIENHKIANVQEYRPIRIYHFYRFDQTLCSIVDSQETVTTSFSANVTTSQFLYIQFI